MIGIERLQPRMNLIESLYLEELKNLEVVNLDRLFDDVASFSEGGNGSFYNDDKVKLIHPIKIFCDANRQCQLHSGKWPFFYDSIHLSDASTDFVVDRLSTILKSG